MKICLIEPKSPSYHVFSEYKIPRLGLPLIGAILKSQGHDVVIYCEEITPLNWDDVLSSDVVGISTTTSTAPGGYAIADRIKSRKKDTPVIMGGVHATFLPEEALEHADYVVRGEGEETTTELISSLEHDSLPLSDIKGISYREGTKIRHNPSRPPIMELDQLPFPDLSLIVGYDVGRLTPVMTSRGCPFDCNFCSVTTFWGKRYRFRSAENIIAELKEKKPKNVFFYDDNFTANVSRTKKLLRLMIEEGLNIHWSAQTRTDVVKDKELLELMKESGCFLVHLGLESINPDTLKTYNKRQEVRDIVEAIKTLRKYGIKSHGMFVFGSDKDDIKTLRDTVKFALKNKIFTVQFLVLTPLPGSKLYEQLDREGRIFTKDWSLYDGHKVVYEPAKMSVYQLQVESYKAMRKFYSRWQCLKLFASFRFVAWYFRSRVGYKTVKKWWKKNKDFVKSLKKLSLKH